MKKITLLLMLMLTSVSFAQLKTSTVDKGETIGKIGAPGIPYVIMKKYSNSYNLSYRNLELIEIEDWNNLEISDSEFNDLYDFIVAGFENPGKDEILVELEKSKFSLIYTKALGSVNVQIRHWRTDNASVTGLTQAMSKKQIDKLFGKKK